MELIDQALQYSKKRGRNSIETEKYLEGAYKKLKILENEYKMVRNQEISPSEKRRFRNKKNALKARIREKEEMS